MGDGLWDGGGVMATVLGLEDEVLVCGLLLPLLLPRGGGESEHSSIELQSSSPSSSNELSSVDTKSMSGTESS